MKRALITSFCIWCGFLIAAEGGIAGVPGKANLMVRQAGTTLSRPSVQVGDVLDVELFMEGETEAVTGVAVYLNFDDAYFELIPAWRYGSHIKPFWQGTWLFGTVLANSTLGDKIGNSGANYIPRFQLFYNENIPRAYNGQQRAAQGEGVVAWFQLLVTRKPPDPLTAIVVDQVSSTGNISGYFVREDPGNLRQFATVRNLLVTIEDGAPQVADTGFAATVAGNGEAGFSSDGGPATDAKLNHPHAICGDESDNLYIADTKNHRIRKVDASGRIHTVVGDGFRSKDRGRFSGDWGPATLASLSQPYGVCTDGSGNLYIADTGNHRVRKVDAAGNISTVAGSGKYGFTGDGVVAIFGRLYHPYGVCVDASGNVYIADKDNHRVRKVDASGIITTVAGNGSRGYSGDGVPATLASLNRPRDVFADASGNLYIADTDNRRVRKVDASGIITTVAGNGESRFYGDWRPATSAGLTPSSVYVDGSGNLYIADREYGRIRKVDVSGIIVTLAGNGEKKPKGDGGRATETALSEPSGVYVDREGRLYISEASAHRVLMVTPSAPPGGGPAMEPPKISISSEALNFGELTVGERKTLQLKVSNIGEDSLKVVSVVAGSRDFAVSKTQFALDAQQKKTVNITFHPTQAGAIEEALELSTNDPDRPAVRVALRATVRPRVDGVPRLVTAIDVLEFGAVGATGIAELRLPIANAGGKRLQVFNVVSTDLQVAVTPKALSVQPGKQRILIVQFHPRPGRERTGEIVLNSDDPDRPTVRIPWKAAVGTAGKALAVVASAPETGATGVSEKTELVLTFDAPLLSSGKFVALDARLIPGAISGPLLDHFSLNRNGRTVRLPVALAPDTYYRLVVSGAKGRSGEQLGTAFEIGFSTGSAPVALGSISGMVAFADGRAFEGSVVAFDGSGNLIDREAIGGAGGYALPNLPAGDYQVFADVFAEGAGAVSGGYDANGDGLADAVKLAAGRDVKGIDLVLAVPAVTDTTDTPPPPVNEGVLAALDLDSAPGNQVQRMLTGVQAEDEFTVSVYAAHTVDLAGYAVTLAYDTTQVVFKRVDENGGEGEKNLLSAAGGSAVFIRPPPQDGRAELAGAILGPTQETTPSGDGLMGVFRFVAREGFSRADFQISRLILESGAAQDSVVAGGTAVVSSASGGPSGEPGAEIPGWVRVDLNVSEGNQDLTTQTGVASGDTVRVQLFADGFPEVTGFGFLIEFDPNALAYEEGSFAAGGFIPGASPLVTDRGGLLDVGVASLTGATGSGSAFLGQLAFRVTDAFSESAYLAVTAVGLSLKNGTLQNHQIRVVARVRSEAGTLKGDFDGDGSVGFRDFLAFAQAFGGTDARFDINGDGAVGFQDFLAFARMFGRSARRAGKPVMVIFEGSDDGDAGPGVNRNARVRLEPVAGESADEIGVTVRLTDAVRIRGYGLRVAYDTSTMVFVSATSRLASAFAEGAGPQPVALQAQRVEGEVLLADVLRPEAAVEGSAEVAQLVFRLLHPGVSGPVEITEALVADGMGRINRIPGTHLESSMPPAYSLSKNTPNPFNPSTQIAYHIPEPGAVSLVVYSLLGQEVRALVREHQEAGSYRVTWDGMDAYGRSVGSGIYFYRLTSGTFVQTHRMMLLK